MFFFSNLQIKKQGLTPQNGEEKKRPEKGRNTGL
jgi:hypothetical protein